MLLLFSIVLNGTALLGEGSVQPGRAKSLCVWHHHASMPRGGRENLFADKATGMGKNWPHMGPPPDLTLSLHNIPLAWMRTAPGNPALSMHSRLSSHAALAKASHGVWMLTAKLSQTGGGGSQVPKYGALITKISQFRICGYCVLEMFQKNSKNEDSNLSKANVRSLNS